MAEERGTLALWGAADVSQTVGGREERGIFAKASFTYRAGVGWRDHGMFGNWLGLGRYRPGNTFMESFHIALASENVSANKISINSNTLAPHFCALVM